MLQQYYKETYTHNYIMGVKTKERVLAFVVDNLDYEGLCLLFTSLTTSRTLRVIRYSSNKAKVAYLQNHAVKVLDLCDIETFENSRRVKTNGKGKAYVENRGEYFEYLVSQALGGIQNEQANLKHTKGGDIEVRGIAYQVKYEASGIYLGKI